MRGDRSGSGAVAKGVTVAATHTETIGPESTVEPVRTRADLRAFLNLDLKLYTDKPLYAPPLRYDLTRRIEKWTQPPRTGEEPHGEAILFLARRRGEPVGRIAASIDHSKNRDRKNVHGAFGMFECRFDHEIAQSLFRAAEEWLAARGVTRILGPYGFTQEDPYPGLLVEGFDLTPSFGMTYSHDYYPRMVAAAGYRPAMDLRSYAIDSNTVPASMAEKAAAALGRPEVRIRSIDMKRIWKEAELMRNIFNSSLHANWEFVPFSKAQVKGMVQELRLLADPRVVLFVEVNKEPAGCVINIPCYNDVLRVCRGRLFPTGLIRLLLAKRSRSRLRPYALGILPPYRREGLAALLIYETFMRGAAAGYRTGEVTWVLGNNAPMNELAAQFTRPESKVHQIFEKDLCAPGDGFS